MHSQLVVVVHEYGEIVNGTKSEQKRLSILKIRKIVVRWAIIGVLEMPARFCPHQIYIKLIWMNFALRVRVRVCVLLSLDDK